MYFKQPTKDFCKFRFTLHDWIKMTHFYDGIRVEPTYLQARAIFWRLWQANAFRFVECDREHYPETMQLHRMGNDGFSDFQKINSTIISNVNDLQNESKGLLSAIETLQVGYNEMKEHFAISLNECANMQSIDVIKCVHTQLNEIKKLFDHKFDASDSRRKGKSTRTIDGCSMSRGRSKKMMISETEVESELNESASSYSGSNDGSTSYSANDDEDVDDNTECLNIGSKRYNLKRRALQKETGELHRLKSTIVQMPKTPTKINRKTKVEKPNSPEPQIVCDELQKNAISIVDHGEGSIIINHQRKVYNRHSKEYKSRVRKQFIDYPEEASEEIDTISPRKRAKRKLETEQRSMNQI